MTVKLLRGLIKCAEGEGPTSFKNLQILIEDDFKFERKEDKAVYDVIREFALTSKDSPQLDVIKSEIEKKYTTASDEYALLGLIADQPKLDEASFRWEIKSVKDEDRIKKASLALQKAIHQLSDPKKKIQDRLLEVLKSSSKELFDLTNDIGHSRTYGVVTETKDLFIYQLDERRKKVGRVGILSGFEVMDICFRGFKPGDLVLIVAYASECKTLLCKNIAYNAVKLGWNVLYVSVEMSFLDLEDSFYAMHSSETKWGRTPINYKDLKDGIVDDVDRKFLEKVAIDFNDRSVNGKLAVFQPRQPMTFEDFALLCEIENAKAPIHLIILDYPLLLKIKKEEYDKLLRDLKQFALTFDNGRGIPLICPHQINREGKSEFEKKIDKNKPAEYSLTNLAGTSEAERSSDIVIALAYPKKWRVTGQLLAMNLKNRKGELFSNHYLQVNNVSGRILNSGVVETSKADREDIQEDLEVIRKNLDISELL